MDLKKLTGKLTTIVAAGAMVMSIGGGVVWANNCKDEYAHMSFDESAGEYLDYTSSRLKEDTSCGYIKGIESSNGYSFNATLVGVDETGYCEDFELIDYDVNPGDEIWMYNYVKENGYNYAAVKCESNTGDDYSVGFLWSPDSVYSLIKLFIRKKIVYHNIYTIFFLKGSRYEEKNKECSNKYSSYSSIIIVNSNRG